MSTAPPVVKISAALPDSERLNGLGTVHERALMAPQAEFVAVVRFRVDKITRDVRTGAEVVLLRIWHVEPVEGDGAREAREIADLALEDRLGIVRLPFADAGDDDDSTGAPPTVFPIS
jgi:hypothetical protein